MSWHLTGSERRKCPAEFQKRVTLAGGLNRYGGPNFDIQWGQTAKIRVGGVEMLQMFDEPCWILRQWRGPECFGTPEIYYQENPGCEYPYRGQYEIIQPFKWAGVINGKLVREFMPLNSMMIDYVVTVVRLSKDVTYSMRFAALKDANDRKEKAKADRIEDVIRDAHPAYLDAVSYSRQGCRTSYINQKIAAIEKNWKRAMSIYRMLPKGPSCFDRQILPN